MLNQSKRNKIIQNNYPNLRTGTSSSSTSGYTYSLVSKLRRRERKKNNENIIFLITVISILIGSAIAFSF